MNWLGRTQLLYKQAGHPPHRQLARDVGMSHTHVANILNGRTVPSLPMLFALLNGLTGDSVKVQSILTQFANEVPDHQARTTQTEHRPGPTQDDMKALTAAIVELNGLLREFLQEQRRYPE